MFGLKSLVLSAIREALNEEAVAARLAYLISTRFNPRVNAAVDRINDLVGQGEEIYHETGMKGYFLKRAVVALLTDLGEENEQIGQALKAGHPYVKAVLDELSVNELLTAAMPVKDMVLPIAVEKASSFRQ